METAQTNPKTSLKPEGIEESNQTSDYTVHGRRFIVTSIFAETGQETLGTILMRLLKSEAASAP
jgi:hypothetical protein